jgi:FkbM family methyltransferase
MNSQIAQDLWVLEVLKNKKNGYFIEIGAGDGIYASNTHGMEKLLGWKGLCVEPNPNLYEKLEKNRNSLLSNDLIYSDTGSKLLFQLDGTLSGIINNNTGGMISLRDKERKFLYTISITDLFLKYNIPKHIDYLSIDVEGQEYNILKNFPFNKYTVSCMTVEHNEPHQGSELRNNLRRLLTQNGYIFVKGNDDVLNWGHGPIDDFYIHHTLKKK